MRYARLVRAHRALIIGAMFVCTVAAIALALTRKPEYVAHTQLFVSVPAEPGNLSPSETYQGGLFSQQRVESYARIVDSPGVAQAVIDRLHLDRSVPAVQSQIKAAVEPGTVLIDVAVTDRSPAFARAIASAVAERLPAFVNELESTNPQRSPVKVSVTSPARLPEAATSTPVVAYILLGLLLGAVLGVGAAVLRELLDKRVRDDEDAEALAGAPILGHVPYDRWAVERPLVMVDAPSSAGAEAYRRLRTNLRMVGPERRLGSLVVSSAVAGEGKSLVVANLGVALAQTGAAVVLVDADLRRPRLHSLLGLDRGPGLSDLLIDDHLSVEQLLHRHESLALEVLGSGPMPPNPSELLGSARCQALLHLLMRRADVVLIDTPALMAVNDAAVLAPHASAVVLVVRVPSTRAEHLRQAAGALRAAGKPPVGVILDGVPIRSWPYANGKPPVTADALEHGLVWQR